MPNLTKMLLGLRGPFPTVGPFIGGPFFPLGDTPQSSITLCDPDNVGKATESNDKTAILMGTFTEGIIPGLGEASASLSDRFRKNC